MKIVYYMSCLDDNGDYELWFDENKKLLCGYYYNDAMWRDEYFNPIFKKIVEIKSLKYNKKLAKESVKQLWG